MIVHLSVILLKSFCRINLQAHEQPGCILFDAMHCCKYLITYVAQKEDTFSHVIVHHVIAKLGLVPLFGLLILHSSAVQLRGGYTCNICDLYDSAIVYLFPSIWCSNPFSCSARNHHPHFLKAIESIIWIAVIGMAIEIQLKKCGRDEYIFLT